MNILCVSIFLTWLPNAFSARVEQTPREATKRPGETLTINCVLRDTSYSLYSTSWFIQRPGRSGWERLSIGGRYAESVNKPAKSFSLKISNLMAEDTATYFCKAQETIFRMGCAGTVIGDNYYDGAGTRLTVKAAKQPTPPNVTLVYSATAEQKAQGFVELICLMSEYLPGNIAVTWQKNGQAVQSGFTTTSSTESSDKTFTSASVLKVPLNEWASGAVYSCSVSHSATSSNIRKEIRAESEYALFLRDPTVEEMWINKTATLVCEVIATTPAGVSISWSVGETERADGVETEQAAKIGSQYVTVSRLTSSVTEWDSGVEYSCSVQDNQSAAPLSKRTRTAKAKPVKPGVRLLSPSPEEVQSAGIATLTCMITGFYPDDITVLWQKDRAAFYSNATSLPTALQQDMTFSTRSLLYLTADDWKKDATYTCVVTHPPSQSIVKANISTSKNVGEIPLDLDDYSGGEEEFVNLDEDVCSASTLLVFVILFMMSMMYSAFTTTIKSKAHECVVKTAQRIIGTQLPTIENICHKRCLGRAKNIIKDASHFNHGSFTLLPTGRRYRSHRSRTSRHRKNYVPEAVTLLKLTSQR